jgi:hypothetical protein
VCRVSGSGFQVSGSKCGFRVAGLRGEFISQNLSIKWFLERHLPLKIVNLLFTMNNELMILWGS